MNELRARARSCGMNARVWPVVVATWLGCGDDDADRLQEQPAPVQADAATFTPEASVLIAFNQSALELPEGISADSHGDLYVTLAATGAVMRVRPSGELAEVARLTLPPPLGQSFFAGLIHGADDALYVAVKSADATALATGVYRIPAGGGPPALFASSPELTVPNAFAWDDGGALFVSDTAAGAIFKADRDGGLTLWIQDSLLRGNRAQCDANRTGEAGANGIAFVERALYVANADLGSIVRVPVQADGSAGPPESWLAPDCSRTGLDGITFVDGVIYAAVYLHDIILAIHSDRRAEVYASGAPFDGPASLTLWQGRGRRELAITNLALERVRAGQVGNPAVLTLSLPPSAH